ncbi:sterol 3-beta-glucosyltransferase UGT80B1 isoform X1 [Salvia divinorum]|uniref:Sterol 3-beta-glucosyltransferase UGT80B1 isoform X1 n=1 Tax=Salvia divinorum TaxID=28513 RepID=A0ABD1FR02_SALDI
MRTKPIVAFMAFGTKGDVYPIAAIAAAFASDQKHYEVAFVTHSAHENMKRHLGAKRISYFSISSPPVLSFCQDHDHGGSIDESFPRQKKEITRKHRQECVSVFERIYGEDPVMDGDLVFINFFALEGWSLAELFHVRCVVVAPYVVPYSAPTSFERQFRNELPLLYKYLREAPSSKIGWEDVIHWMWPLFNEDWGKWRSLDLNLSFLPFTDPVTDLPTWHDRPSSPLLLSADMELVKKLLNALVTGHLQFGQLNDGKNWCQSHAKLKSFLDSSEDHLIFISLSSIGSMGYFQSPQIFLRVLGNVLSISSHRFILFSAGYGPLDTAINLLAQRPQSTSEQMQSSEIQISLFDGRLFCFSGEIPYNLLFPKCAAVIHHGGSGTTAAALHAGVSQVICPFILDQFYWAERMFWLGVASEPLNASCVLPDKDDESCILGAATLLVQAINKALSPQVKSRAKEIADRISTEDGVSTALRIIKEEILGVK